MTKGAGVIFAGGRATRLGGMNKADICVGDQSCFERVSAALSKQFSTLAVSVAAPGAHELPVIIDWPSADNYGGVVYSVLAVLDWASENGFDYVVTSPCDTPFLPNDFAARLILQSNGSHPVVCKSDGRVHGLHALWPASNLAALKAMVMDKGERKIARIHEHLGSQILVFDCQSFDPFFNINTPQDLERAVHLLSE